MCSLLTDGFRLLKQFNEDPDFGPQHIGIERCGNKVDRTQRVALRHLYIVVERRNKNDWRVLAAPPLPNQRRGFKAVHLGHVYIKQNHRKVILQQRAQRFTTRSRFDDVLTKLGERGLYRQNFLGHVVDDKNVDWLSRLHQFVSRRHWADEPLTFTLHDY